MAAPAQDKAYRVNDLLKDYVAVHDDIYGGSLLRRIIPIPGLFYWIHFDQHVQTLHTIAAELRYIRHYLATNELEQTLAKYLDALSPAVERLEQVCEALYTSNHGGPSYGYFEYLADMKGYNQLVKSYVALGDQLNEVWARYTRR